MPRGIDATTLYRVAVSLVIVISILIFQASARQSVILSGWWVGAKDPLLTYETRSVGGGSYAPCPPPAQDDSEDEIVVDNPGYRRMNHSAGASTTTSTEMPSSRDEIVTTFLDRCPILLEEIRSALDAGDTAAASVSTMKLLGCASLRDLDRSLMRAQPTMRRERRSMSLHE